MKIIEGDLIKKAIKGEFDVIVHGCNCFCTMEAGIARGIKSQFPEAFNADLATPMGSREKLGTCSIAEIQRNGITLFVVNAYTQFDYAGPGVKVDYDAVSSCMAKIKEKFKGKKIGFPKIGAGLAGGDWNIISKIIDEVLSKEDITLVVYKPAC